MSRALKTIQSPWLLGSVGLYVCSLAVVYSSKSYGIGDALMMLVVFGIVLSGTALLITRNADEVKVADSPGFGGITYYLALLAFVAIYLVWGVGALDYATRYLAGESAGAAYVLNIARKLLVFVVVPLAVLKFFADVSLSDLGIARGSSRIGKGRALLLTISIGVPITVLQFLAGSGAGELFRGAFTAGEIALAVPLCFAALVIEVGLVEEIFYRVILQTRLSAFFRSEATGIAAASLIFALSHAPGLILRGGASGVPGASPVETIAFTVATLTLPAVMFGIIWSRSRNLLVLVVIHAITDLPPNLPEFINTFLR